MQEVDFHMLTIGFKRMKNRRANGDIVRAIHTKRQRKTEGLRERERDKEGANKESDGKHNDKGKYWNKAVVKY